MRGGSLLTTWLALLTVAVAAAQTGTDSEDPVTGTWGTDGLAYLELKLDGRTGVTGTTIWRNGDWESRAAIKAGSFDPKTGALKLEGEAKDPDGVMVTYAIEGRIENDTVSGTFEVGDLRGEFSFKKQRPRRS